MDLDNARKRRRQQWLLYLIGAALVVAFVGLVFAILLLLQQVRSTSEETQRQVELNARLRQLQAILIHLGDAESSQRGLLLTGDHAYLAPYLGSVARIPQAMAGLEGIEDVDPALAQRAAGVRSLVAAKLAELAETVRLHEAGRASEALALVQAGAGRQAMARAREEINAISSTVRASRDAAVREITQSGQRRESLAIAAVAALALCFVLAATQISLLLGARTRFERQLQLSETRHRKIVEDQSELISLARRDGTLTYVNPAYARQFGTTAQALTGGNLFDHVDPAHREQVRQLIEAVFDTGTPAHGENRMRLPDGRENWVAWTNNLQADADGQPQLHSVGRDITPQKQAEAALRDSEEFLARTGRLAGVGGWEIDLLAGKVRWSEQVRQLHEVAEGFAPDVESGIAFFEPDARTAVREAFHAARSEGTPFDLELPLVTARGRRRWVRVVGDAQRGANGIPVRLVGAMQDITERKDLEVRVQASERFIREITDNLPVAVAFVDHEERYRFVNKMYARRFQQPRDAILGRKPSELTGPAEDLARGHAAAVLQGRPQRFVVQEQLGDQRRLMDTQMVPAFDEHGAIIGFYATGVDITEIKRTEERLRELTEILDNTPDYVVQTDWTGRVHYLNPSARRALGFGADQPVHAYFFNDFNTPETNARYVKEITPAIKRDGVWLGETTVLAEGARVVPVNHLVIGHRDAQGRIARYSAVMRDISSEVRARAELQLQTSTLHAIIEAIPALVAVFDRHFRYRLVNREFERQRAVRREDVIGRGVAELFGQDEYNARWPWVQRVLAGETVSHERVAVHAGRRRNVSVTYIPLRLDDGTVDGFITVAQDITSHREEERRLLDLSERDALTGLLNRAGFNRYLEHQRATATAQPLALLYIDLDRFKPVNDTHGHATGDAVLQQFAQRLKNLVRPTDGVARLGGDEFAIVLPGVRDPMAAQAIAQKVVEAAGQPFVVDGIAVSIGASVGVALGDGGPDGVRQLMARADEKAYEAKAAGRGRAA